MALRVRKDGRIVCAALRPPEPGDTYIDDTLHHQMSSVHRVIVSEPMRLHRDSAEWWWRGSVPPDVEVASEHLVNQERERDKMIRSLCAYERGAITIVRLLEKIDATTARARWT